MPIELETELVAPVQKYLIRRGFRQITSELQFHDYSIDLYGYRQRTGESVAVELKLKKWSIAINQAMVYQLCANFVYIGMPESYAGKVDSIILNEMGIGLMSVMDSGRITILVPARESGVLRPNYHSQEINLLERQRNART